MEHNLKLIIEDTLHVGLIKHFLNTKTQSHKVTKSLSPKANIAKLLSP